MNCKYYIVWDDGYVYGTYCTLKNRKCNDNECGLVCSEYKESCEEDYKEGYNKYYDDIPF